MGKASVIRMEAIVRKHLCRVRYKPDAVYESGAFIRIGYGAEVFFDRFDFIGVLGHFTFLAPNGGKHENGRRRIGLYQSLKKEGGTVLETVRFHADLVRSVGDGNAFNPLLLFARQKIGAEDFTTNAFADLLGVYILRNTGEGTV